MHMLYIEKGLEKLFQVWSCWNLRRGFPCVEGLHVCDLHSRGCDPGGRPPAVFAVVGCFIQGICPVRSRVLLKVSFYFFLRSESNLEDSFIFSSSLRISKVQDHTVGYDMGLMGFIRAELREIARLQLEPFPERYLVKVCCWVGCWLWDVVFWWLLMVFVWFDGC